eukprot:jgi/Mesen1/3473/ME000195S02620
MIAKGDGMLEAWLNGACPLAGLPSWRAFGLLGGYAGALALGGVLLPGPVINGTKLADGTCIRYKVNGFRLLVVLLLALGLGSYCGAIQPTMVADMAGELFATTLVCTLLMSVLLYVVGRASTRHLSSSLKPHLSGNVLLDWWCGVQLNPHVFGLDLKFFCLRPGMMGWLLINLSVAARQLRAAGSLSSSMALYQAFTAIYVLDYFWFEEYMTSTWDIIAENFGFMLVLGDLVWIPFTFSLQAWWLLRHPRELSWPEAAVISALFAAGFAIFRGANMQKHLYKRNPKALFWGRPPKVIGGRLLISGFWGIARHSNYLGDLLLALSYSLPCGTSAVLPYFYPIYLLILLIDRERRDEARCRKKYGDVWVQYCQAVPYRILPYVY